MEEEEEEEEEGRVTDTQRTIFFDSQSLSLFSCEFCESDSFSEFPSSEVDLLPSSSW